MDACDLHLESLIEAGITECQKVLTKAEAAEISWLTESAKEAIDTMRGYQALVRSGNLPRPSSGAGLGLSRGLGEWADQYEQLMALAYEIDRYYAKDCNCPRVGS